MNPITELVIKYNGHGSPLTVQGITTGFKKSQPSITIASLRGTFDNPELIQNGDQLGVLKFTAYTGAEKGAGFVNAAFVSAFVSDDQLVANKESIDATLMLGCIKSVFNGNYVTINPDGVLSAPKIVLNFDKNSVEESDKSKDWWMSNGCRVDEYDVPFTINTKSTGVKINQSGNFRQPALIFNSYDDDKFKTGWTAFNRFRGTQDSPEVCKNGDFIYAFDWMGKACATDPWEWGMAQTAIIDEDPVAGFLPVSMNWVTRDTPYGEPKVRVKISNNGTLTAYSGLIVKEKLDLNLEELPASSVDTETVKYFKINLNGTECAIAVHPIKV